MEAGGRAFCTLVKSLQKRLQGSWFGRVEGLAPKSEENCTLKRNHSQKVFVTEEHVSSFGESLLSTYSVPGPEENKTKFSPSHL